MLAAWERVEILVSQAPELTAMAYTVIDLDVLASGAQLTVPDDVFSAM